MKVKIILGVSGLFLNLSAWAQIWSDDGVANQVTRSSGAPTVVEQHAVEARTDQQIDCTDGNDIPLKLLHAIMYPPKTMKIERMGNGRFKLTMSRYFTACMDLEIKHFVKGNNVYVQAINNYDLSNYPDAQFPSMNDKYEQCLKDKGFVDGSQKLLKEKASSADINPGFVRSFSVSSSEIDERENIYAYFSSPRNSAEYYGAALGEGFITDVPAACRNAEKLQAEVVYESPFQKSKEHYETICSTRDHNEILKAMMELHESNTGNARALDQEMRKILLAMLNDQLYKVVEDLPERHGVRLAELSGQIKEASRDNDRRKLERLVTEYSQLVDELEEFYLNVKIAELKNKYDEQDNTTDPAKLDAIAEEIAKLRDSIASFAKEAYIHTDVISAIEKLGLKTQADRVYEFKMKSYFYGKFDGKDEEQPDRLIAAQMVEFKEHSTTIERDYLAEHEGEIFSDDMVRQVKRDQERRDYLWQQYLEQEAEYAQACQVTMFGSVQNPARCSRGQEGAATRREKIDSIIQEYNDRIMANATLAERYAKLEGKYQEERGETSSDRDGDSDDSILFDYSIGDVSTSGTAGRTSRNTVSRTGTSSTTGMPATAQYSMYPNANYSSMQYSMYPSTNYGTTGMYGTGTGMYGTGMYGTGTGMYGTGMYGTGTGMYGNYGLNLGLGTGMYGTGMYGTGTGMYGNYGLNLGLGTGMYGTGGLTYPTTTTTTTGTGFSTPTYTVPW